MKERPILFSGPMVSAILEDRKTTTRRVVKGMTEPIAYPRADKLCEPQPDMMCVNYGGTTWWWGETLPFHNSHISRACPLGQRGDRLYVRETWRTCRSLDHVKPRDIEQGSPIDYLSDEWKEGFGPLPFDRGGIRPSIFMPKWASRITLEIVGVRVERLQEISGEDALAEGIEDVEGIIGFHCNGGRHQEIHGTRYYYDGCQDEGFEDPREAFAALWNSINGKPRDRRLGMATLPRRNISWSANPWVWVIEFKRVTA